MSLFVGIEIFRFTSPSKQTTYNSFYHSVYTILFIARYITVVVFLVFINFPYGLSNKIGKNIHTHLSLAILLQHVLLLFMY